MKNQEGERHGLTESDACTEKEKERIHMRVNGIRDPHNILFFNG